MTVTDERTNHTTGITTELVKLLAAGFDVYFSADPSGYVASVSGDGYECDAIAATPAEALWAASPFHGEDERYEDTPETLTAAAVASVFSDGFRAGQKAERDGAEIRQRDDCKCGHPFAEHNDPSPDVEGIRGARMCDREDCYCLAYRAAR